MSNFKYLNIHQFYIPYYTHNHIKSSLQDKNSIHLILYTHTDIHHNSIFALNHFHFIYIYTHTINVELKTLFTLTLALNLILLHSYFFTLLVIHIRATHFHFGNTFSQFTKINKIFRFCSQYSIF